MAELRLCWAEDALGAMSTSREVRGLLQGMLLQLELPAEVKPNQSTARRSNATGNLLLTMPKEHTGKGGFNIACSRCVSPDL